MKTAEHAAQLAEALRGILEQHADFEQMTDEGAYALRSGRESLAAWDKHNAPAPKQEALL